LKVRYSYRVLAGFTARYILNNSYSEHSHFFVFVRNAFQDQASSALFRDMNLKVLSGFLILTGTYKLGTVIRSEKNILEERDDFRDFSELKHLL
jgi:hypothetical protein